MSRSSNRRIVVCALVLAMSARIRGHVDPNMQGIKSAIPSSHVRIHDLRSLFLAHSALEYSNEPPHIISKVITKNSPTRNISERLNFPSGDSPTTKPLATYKSDGYLTENVSQTVEYVGKSRSTCQSFGDLAGFRYERHY